MYKVHTHLSLFIAQGTFQKWVERRKNKREYPFQFTTSVVGSDKLEREQFLLRYGTNYAVGNGIRNAEKSVALFDDVVAEHTLALIDAATDEFGRTSHAHTEHAVAWYIETLLQCLLQNTLVPFNIEHLGLTFVFD